MLGKRTDPWRIETREAAQEEDKLRSRLLVRESQGGKLSLANLKLALKLAAAQNRPVASLASSAHFRRVRKAVIRRLGKAFAPYDDADLRAVTILNSNWVVQANALDQFPAYRLTTQFRNHLMRCGFAKSREPLICFIHGEFEATAGVFVLHLHGITTAAGANALHLLKGRAGFAKTATAAAPIRSEKVRNLGRQFSYVLKSFWPMRSVRLTDSGPRRDRRGKRVVAPYHSAMLRWLDRHSVVDLTIAVNIWSRRLGGPSNMKALIFKLERFAKAERSEPIKIALDELFAALGRPQGHRKFDNTAKRPCTYSLRKPVAPKSVKSAKKSGARR